MFYRRTALVRIVLLSSLVVTAGCSSEQEAEVAMRRACLSRLGETFVQYHTEKGTSPTDLASFTTFVESQAKADDKIASELIRRMEEADVIVFWNATLGEGASDTSSNGEHVLAFEATCPGNGGYMVTVGGKVDHVTGKKFSEMTMVAQDEAVEQE